MPSEKLLQDLGLRETPFFGDLAKKKNRLRALFKFRAETIESTVRRISSGIDSRIVLVTGAPGVGKSTFLEYLAQVSFPDRFKRISLASRIDSITEYDYAEVNTEQLLFVFRRIESFLINILTKHNAQLPSRHQDGQAKLDSAQILSRIPGSIGAQNAEKVSDERLSIVIELIRDHILPLCVRVNEADLPDKYCLAIDDVDYIFPFHQTDILRLLVSMVEVTDNPVIFYSARPVAGQIAQSYISRFLHHHTSGSPINLRPLSVMSIIDSRFEAASLNGRYFNILADAKVRSILEGLSSSNIRAALKYAELCYLAYPGFAGGAVKPFDADTVVRILYGDPTPNKDSSSDPAVHQGPLVNILRAIRPGDPVPYEFVALFSLINKKMIDRDFYASFNANCAKMNPKGHVRPLTDNEVLGILRICHQEDLVSRATHVNFDHIPREKEAYSYKSRLENHTLELSTPSTITATWQAFSA